MSRSLAVAQPVTAVRPRPAHNGVWTLTRLSWCCCAPADPPAYDQAELDRIQAEHLAFYDRLRESGQVVTNGPVRDQADPSLRGLSFYRLGSLAEARQLAETDPAVRAGRLAVEIMTWYCPPGTMSKPGRAITL